MRLLQGRLLGKLLMLGFDLNVKAKLVETQLEAVTLEIVKTSEIEDETLNDGQLRYSVA